MTEQNNNNPVAGGQEGTEKLDDEFLPDDAQPLCLKCLKPCHPLQNYCDNCDSNQVINPLAPYMPFVNIRFNYDIYLTMWRKVWYGRDTSIIGKLFFLFLIILQAPYLLIFGFPLFLIGKIENSRLRKSAITVFWTLVFVLLIIYLLSL